MSGKDERKPLTKLAQAGVIGEEEAQAAASPFGALADLKRKLEG